MLDFVSKLIYLDKTVKQTFFWFKFKLNLKEQLQANFVWFTRTRSNYNGSWILLLYDVLTTKSEHLKILGLDFEISNQSFISFTKMIDHSL